MNTKTDQLKKYEHIITNCAFLNTSAIEFITHIHNDYNPFICIYKHSVNKFILNLLQQNDISTYIWVYILRYIFSGYDIAKELYKQNTKQYIELKNKLNMNLLKQHIDTEFKQSSILSRIKTYPVYPNDIIIKLFKTLIIPCMKEIILNYLFYTVCNISIGYLKYTNANNIAKKYYDNNYIFIPYINIDTMIIDLNKDYIKSIIIPTSNTIVGPLKYSKYIDTFKIKDKINYTENLCLASNDSYCNTIYAYPYSYFQSKCALQTMNNSMKVIFTDSNMDSLYKQIASKNSMCITTYSLAYKHKLKVILLLSIPDNYTTYTILSK